MKRLKWLMLVLVSVLLFVGIASVFACPPKPTCPAGMIEEISAEKVIEGRYGFYTWRGWIWRDWRDVDSCRSGWQRRGWDFIYWECREGWTEPKCVEPTPEPTPVPTEIPDQGEWCERCSNIFEGWVKWYDRDGGCDDDWWNQRTEYPGDERCVIPDTETVEPTPTDTPVPTEDPTLVPPTETPEPTPTDTPVPTEDSTEEPTLIPPTETPEITETPEPTLIPTQCTWMQYVLVDVSGHKCFIKRNFERGDQPSQLPEEYQNTPLMRELCSKTCTGKELPPFGQLDKFSVTCAECGEVCR